MQQRVNPRHELHECPEIGHSHDPARDYVAHGELLRSLYPGILIREFHTEGDLRLVDILDEDLYFLARL